MDRVVENALKSLTKRVNLSTNLTNSFDKEATVDLFKILRDNGIKFNPCEIETWAINNVWTQNGAKELKRISKDINEGKRLRCKDSWNKNIIDIWSK